MMPSQSTIYTDAVLLINFMFEHVLSILVMPAAVKCKIEENEL